MPVPILMYHAVDDSRSVISVAPRTLDWQLRWLKDNHYESFSFGQVVDRIQTGEKFPPRSVCITFDDAFESVYQAAFPILQTYGFTATVFVVTGCIGADNGWYGQPAGIPRWRLSSWDQLEEMHRYGLEIGSHTHTHPRLDQLPPDAVEKEVCLSRELLEQRLGTAVPSFAYPYGRFSSMVRSAVQKTYQGACTTRLGFGNPDSDIYELERVDVYYLQSPWLFHGLSKDWIHPYLWLRRNLKQAASVARGRTA